MFDATAHQCALRVLNYPPLEYYEDSGDAGAGGDTKNKMVIRAGSHTDNGALTIVFSGGPGLQLSLNLNQETNANNYTITSNTTTWMDAPYLEGAFIINLGELMLRWTND